MARTPANRQRTKSDVNARLNLKADETINVALTSSPKEKRERTLLDSAIVNLGVAQQYIDQSAHAEEHRLACFHYAMAILARHRPAYERQRHPNAAPEAETTEMIGLARQYLEDAVSWPLLSEQNSKAEEPATGQVIEKKRPKLTKEQQQEQRRMAEQARGLEAAVRISSEASYNLGVLDEIDKEYHDALRNYEQAIRTADVGFADFETEAPAISADEKKRRDDKKLYEGLFLVAQLGIISCEKHKLGDPKAIQKADPQELIQVIERYRKLIRYLDDRGLERAHREDKKSILDFFSRVVASVLRTEETPPGNDRMPDEKIQQPTGEETGATSSRPSLGADKALVKKERPIRSSQLLQLQNALDHLMKLPDAPKAVTKKPGNTSP